MYPQSMFWSKNKKNRHPPANPSFAIQKWGLRGHILHGHVFLMIVTDQVENRQTANFHVSAYITSDFFVLTLICLGDEGLVGGVTLGEGPGESPKVGREKFSTSISASWSD